MTSRYLRIVVSHIPFHVGPQGSRYFFTNRHSSWQAMHWSARHLGAMDHGWNFKKS